MTPGTSTKFIHLMAYRTNELWKMLEACKRWSGRLFECVGEESVSNSSSSLVARAIPLADERVIVDTQNADATFYYYPCSALSGFMAWLVWAVIHIQFLAETSLKFSVFLQWAWTSLSGKRGAQLIIRPRSGN